MRFAPNEVYVYPVCPVIILTLSFCQGTYVMQ